ncbi:uncharacterized protein B0I36DRAFT_132186 [Microdochium trichocladiopsis]|uniref:Uncharacterized protein n=1 Tax=Microdochium trichocladiopsis TaxID=1682393 RepID=A0A9P9BPN0_9PEZI|nr:uncharacterized protein B0I36DRAFT_132186 [Microdochium trichocladiopsis]KAH7029397.1 hypothetical protein B0I36DRAFT_132186 [Microdochium trichocladiopsis]
MSVLRAGPGVLRNFSPPPPPPSLFLRLPGFFLQSASCLSSDGRPSRAPISHFAAVDNIGDNGHQLLFTSSSPATSRRGKPLRPSSRSPSQPAITSSRPSRRPQVSKHRARNTASMPFLCFPGRAASFVDHPRPNQQSSRSTCRSCPTDVAISRASISTAPGEG